ncbi:hypothetical protein GCM10023155_47600 [Bremerella cremea]
MFGFGPQTEEATSLIALYWSPLSEPKVISALKSVGTINSLSVGGKEFSESSLQRLQEIPPLQDISFWEAGVQDFGDLPARHRASIRSLLIYRPAYDLKSLDAIGDCRHLTRLEFEWVTFNDRCEWLKHLPNLKRFLLNRSDEVDHIVPYLRSPNLEEFLADSTDLKDAHLPRIASLPSLRTCIISTTGITDRGLEYFRGHPQLETLFIDRTAITDESISIVESLPSLKKLSLTGTQMSEKAINDYCLRHPEVEIIEY